MRLTFQMENSHTVNERLKDPEFKKEWDALEPEFAIIQAMIDARKTTGLTQKQLSERAALHRATSAESKTAMPIRRLTR